MAALLVGACGGTTGDANPGAGPTTVPGTTPEVTTTAPATTTTEPVTTTEGFVGPERFASSGLFEWQGVEPVIPNGPDGAWDWQYTDPGAAVVVGGVIHVFQNGFVGWPAPVGVGRWTSEDGGSTWVEQNDTPVFDGTDLPYVGRAALASSVVVDDAGTWILYFYTWDAAGWPAAPSSIGRATAPGPDGPFVADPAPILEPGPAGSWDEFFVRSPSVVRDGDTWVMYYAGGTRDVAQIGIATSTDGIVWEKHPEPVLVPGDRREGNVWDQRNVYQPRVVRTNDGWVMAYSSSNTITDATRLVRKTGLAISDDGLTWRRSLGPVISTGQLRADAFWFTELLAVDERYLLFVEVGVGNETAVHLAVADAPLP